MSLSTNKIDDNINVDLLISQIEKRPGLYNNTAPEYSDKSRKSKLWCEVTEAVFSAWSEWEFSQKRDKIREVQKKWRMLKEMFVKHRTSPRLMTSSGKIKKKYRYFQKMSFLIPLLNVQNANNNDTESTITNVVSQECQDLPTRPSTPLDNQDDIAQNYNIDPGLAPPGIYDTEDDGVPVVDSESVNEDLKKLAGVDDSTQFSQLLIPLLNKLTKYQRHYARAEIIRIVRQAFWLGSENRIEDCESPLPTVTPSVLTDSWPTSVPPDVLRPIRLPLTQPHNELVNEINSSNDDGTEELQRDLVYSFPSIPEPPTDQVEAYQDEPIPSCSNMEPPLYLPQRRLTILQDELRYPESDSVEHDV